MNSKVFDSDLNIENSPPKALPSALRAPIGGRAATYRNSKGTNRDLFIERIHEAVLDRPPPQSYRTHRQNKLSMKDEWNRAPILDKISKKTNSGKKERRGDVSPNRRYFKSPFDQNMEASAKTFNDFDLSMDSRAHYEGIVAAYDNSIAVISVKVLQAFKGKKSPTTGELKQAQGLLILLSGVDRAAPIFTDKSNCLQKPWGAIQEYLSSIGKTFNNLQKVRYAIENQFISPNLFRWYRTTLLPILDDSIMSTYLQKSYDLHSFVSQAVPRE